MPNWDSRPIGSEVELDDANIVKIVVIFSENKKASFEEDVDSSEIFSLSSWLTFTRDLIGELETEILTSSGHKRER